MSSIARLGIWIASTCVLALGSWLWRRCAVVLVDVVARTTAVAGGSIQAIGTAESPIVFAAQESARWDYLLVDEAAALSLAQVAL